MNLHEVLNKGYLITCPASLNMLASTRYLCPIIREDLLFIHLADTSLDPRSLLGSHISSRSQPGTFERKEGILAGAMREGNWFVFKKIDRGSNEVVALIKLLIENFGLDKWTGARASLEVVGREVVAADTFAIFATRPTLSSRNGTFTTPTFYGAHKLHEVVAA
ncbi:hypothetical protein F5879DRAFT_1028625 [Lentinula edodes]|nr:hypothetical protein F5879DRAFT_1028625 [Lentinula edodes]